jgi:hypothetical protein
LNRMHVHPKIILHHQISLTSTYLYFSNRDNEIYYHPVGSSDVSQFVDAIILLLIASKQVNIHAFKDIYVLPMSLGLVFVEL